jgi:hypothetical protein
MTTDNFISFPEKELNREEPSGVGRPSSERHVLDFRGALVERRALSHPHQLEKAIDIKLYNALSLVIIPSI